MMQALRIVEGPTSRARSANEINQIVRDRDRPYEMRGSNGPSHQMNSGDLPFLERVPHDYGASDGIASVSVKSPPNSNEDAPLLAPALSPAEHDSCTMYRGMFYEDEVGNKRDGIVISTVVTAILVLVTFLVSQGHERATEVVTWPTTSAYEQDVRITGDYDVNVMYTYDLNGRYLTDWRRVETYNRKGSADSHMEKIRSRIRNGNPSIETIRYDPENPSRSSFRMAVGTRLRWIITPAIIASLAFTWLIAEIIGMVALLGSRGKAHAEINGPILNRILDRRTERNLDGPSSQPPVGIGTLVLRGLCRLRLHDWRWGYLNEGECSQLRECGRCEAINLRTKHQPLWRYLSDQTCLQNRICARCDALGQHGTAHESWSTIGEGNERCDRCGDVREVSDGD